MEWIESTKFLNFITFCATWLQIRWKDLRTNRNTSPTQLTLHNGIFVGTDCSLRSQKIPIFKFIFGIYDMLCTTSYLFALVQPLWSSKVPVKFQTICQLLNHVLVIDGIWSYHILICNVPYDGGRPSRAIKLWIILSSWLDQVVPQHKIFYLCENQVHLECYNW